MRQEAFDIMSATGLMDHPEQEEPPRTVCANQRPERGKEPAGRRCPRPREPGFAHFVRVLPLIPRASPVPVGVLTAAGTLAWPALGLFAGVWVDRLRRRRILVASDLVRAALLGSIPLAFALGHLSLLQLLSVAGLVGGMTVFF